MTDKFPVFSSFLNWCQNVSSDINHISEWLQFNFKLHSLKIKYLCLKEVEWTRPVHTGCISESDDFKNIMNSKFFHLFSFNTYKHNVYITEIRFFYFQFNPFNNLTHWKQKSHFPKMPSFRWSPFRCRHSVSLLRMSPITVWSITTGISVTSCWIQCFNTWTVWSAGALKTGFRQPEWHRVATRRTLWTSFNDVSYYRIILGCTYWFYTTTFLL